MKRRGRRPAESVVEELLRDAKASLLNGFGERISESARDLLHGATRRVALGAAGLAVLGAGLVFLLVAGAEGLKAAGLPASASHLLMGLLGLAGGYFLTRVRR